MPRPDGDSTNGARRVPVLDTWLNVVDVGEGRPVVFLHGNPTSSHLWRHVIAARPRGFRCVAVDLIGMGDSGKPDIDYTLADHIAHVDAFFAAEGLGEHAIVAHDWGVAIGLDHLRREPEQVRAIAMMEGHLRPLTGWHEFDDGGRDLFQALRRHGEGERMVLEQNVFIDTLLPAALLRQLSDDELAPYRSPYATPESRRPLLAWARQIPVAGDPESAAHLVQSAIDHATRSDVPKMLLHADPGAIITPDIVAWCRANLPALEVIDVGGPAGHFLPEDRPDQVAEAVWTWLSSTTSQW